MKSEIQIKNSAGVCRIEIEGTIGVPEEWQFDQPEARVATYEKFRDTVRRIAGIDAPQIVVDIRSTGGDVNDALENNGNGRWLSPEEAVAAGLADTVTDNGERTAPSLAGNIARGWERLLAGIGLNRREELPADRNVLLTAGERQELLRRSATAIRQAQQNASPTCTKPREDPSYGDTVRTANQRAYAEDVKRFKGI